MTVMLLSQDLMEHVLSGHTIERILCQMILRLVKCVTWLHVDYCFCPPYLCSLGITVVHVYLDYCLPKEHNSFLHEVYSYWGDHTQRP